MSVRAEIGAALRGISAWDAAEDAAITATQALLDRGAPLIRTRIDQPDPHLVAYLVVTDGARVVLGHHVKSGLWLPPGGHVDPGETPLQAARRECVEELGLALPFVSPQTLFVTLQETVGPHPHHDLTFWYLLRAERDQSFAYDRSEFRDMVWADHDALPAGSEPQLPRFFAKLQSTGLVPTEDAS